MKFRDAPKLMVLRYIIIIIIIYLFKVDDIAKILHAQKNMLINVNYLIKSEVNKKLYVNILTLSCTML